MYVPSDYRVNAEKLEAVEFGNPQKTDAPADHGIQQCAVGYFSTSTQACAVLQNRSH